MLASEAVLRRAARAEQDCWQVRGEVNLDGRPEPTRIGGWNINDLDALVAANGESHPDHLEEWRAYLFFLRDHASIEGDLPAQFDSLIEDVFAAALGPR